MEKLFVALIFFLGLHFANAQNHLITFQVDGKAYTAKNELLSKGDAVPDNQQIKLSKGSSVIFLDRNGNVYKLVAQGTYSFSDIRKKNMRTNVSLSQKFFARMWQEFTSHHEGQSAMAGVYRGEELMLFPKDSGYVSRQRLLLKWTGNATTFFVFIKTSENAKALKFETNGTTLGLPDHPILADANTIWWSVTTEEFPKEKNMIYRHAFLLNQEEMARRNEEIQQFQLELTALGVTAAATEEAVCNLSGECFK